MEDNWGGRTDVYLAHKLISVRHKKSIFEKVELVITPLPEGDYPQRLGGLQNPSETSDNIADRENLGG